MPGLVNSGMVNNGLVNGGIIRGGLVPDASTAPSTLGSALFAHWKADANVYSDLGTTLVTNGGTVRQWNDQSGNTRHLFQNTSANRPIYRSSSINNLPGIEFDGSIPKILVTTASFSLSPPMELWMLYRSDLVGVTGVNDFIFDGNAITTNDWFSRKDSSTFVVSAGASWGSARTRTDYLPADGIWELLRIKVDGTNSLVETNRYSFLASGTTLGTNALTRWLLGASGSSTRGSYITVAEAFIVSRACTTDEVKGLRAYFKGKYFTSNVNLIMDGNSIGRGFGNPSYQTWQYYLANAYNWNCHIHNFGIDGQTTAQMVSRFDTWITPLFDARNFTKNLVLASEVRNDFAIGGVSTATAIANVTAHVAKCHTAGYKVAWVTPPAAGTGMTTTQRSDVAAEMLAGNTGADVIIDFQNDSIFGPQSVVNDTTYYNADTVHFKDGGNQRAATLSKTGLDTL